jgi:hypothetical protein
MNQRLAEVVDVEKLPLGSVTPTIGDQTRMLVVLAYNREPGVSLSESARMTFYGRLK